MRNCSGRVIALLLLAGGAMTAQAREENLRRVTRIESNPIPAPIEYQFSRTVAAGRIVKAQEGAPGYVKKFFEVVYDGDKPVEKKFIREEKVDATPTVMLMGQAGFPSSRHKYTRGRVLTMEATAYDPSPATIGKGATGYTYTGLKATYGHVAVDPRVIPLGSLVFVEGYGFAIASDIGSAIKGNRIDLCYDERSTALRFGRKQVKVHVLKTP